MRRIGNRSELEAFVRSVELGGFSAAARELRLSPSALSKLVTRLERTLRVRLLNRTTRKVTSTPEGALFLARCRRILAEIEDAENEVGRSRDRPRGRLRVHSGVGFATHQLVPALPAFTTRFPEVQLELLVEDRTLDLLKEGIDIAVRPGPPPPDLPLVARKIFDFRRVLCASPGYLARRGAPRSPDDLLAHNCIVLSGGWGVSRWSLDTAAGRRTIDVSGSVSVNNAECLLRCALSGLGIVRLNEFIVAEALRAGKLVRVLADSPCSDAVAMLALYPHERNRLPRVAAMLDFLAGTFAGAPWRNAGEKTRRTSKRAVSGR